MYKKIGLAFGLLAVVVCAIIIGGKGSYESSVSERLRYTEAEMKDLLSWNVPNRTERQEHGVELMRETLCFLEGRETLPEPHLMGVTLSRAENLHAGIYWLEDGFDVIGIQVRHDGQLVRLPLFGDVSFWDAELRYWYREGVIRDQGAYVEVGAGWAIKEQPQPPHILVIPKSALTGVVYVAVYDDKGGVSNEQRLYVDKTAFEFVFGQNEPNTLSGM